MAARSVEVVFLGDTKQLEAALLRAGEVAKASGKSIGDSFTAGTTKAGGAVTKLANQGASLGVPFSSSLGKIGKSLDEATTRTQKFHQALAAVGKVTIAAGFAGFAAAAYEGVKGATQLQKSMEMLHTQAGATQKQVVELQKGVLNMAGSVGTAPNELAQGLYHVVSNMNAVLPAAQRNTKELQALRIAAEGAKVGNANLEDVTNALGAAIASGLPGVQNYQKAMGVLNATVGAGDMRMQDLADALGTGLLGPMKNYGITLRDVSAALAVFGDNNIRGQEAATKLNSAIRIMAAPSTAAAKALGAINLSSTQLANDMRSGGLVKAISDLKTKLQDSGATASQQALIITRAFGGRQSTGVQLLMGQLDRLKAKYQEVGAGANTFGQDWHATQQTLSQQMDQLKATVQALADKFGAYLIPKLEATAHAISDVVSWLQKHKAVAEDVAGVITGVLGAAVAAFAYQKATAFIGAIGAMGKSLLGLGATSEVAAGEVDAALSSTGVGAVLVALGIAAGELGTHWSQVMSGMQNAANAMKNAVTSALNAVISVLNGAISAFNSTVGQLTGTIGQLGSIASSASATASTYSTGGGSSIGVADTRYGAVNVNTNRAGKPNLPLQLPGSSTAMKIANYLGSQGFSKIAIAGILGNFAQETAGGSLSGINTRDTGSGASGYGGMGLANWTAGRRLAEMQLARSEGKSPTDLGVQLQYLIQELRTTQHSAYTAITGAKTPQQAAHLFDVIFEKGTDPNGVRERAAQQAYQMLGGSGGGGGVGHPSAALQGYLNGTSGGSKPTMRYVNHHPVGKMTEAQWQAYQAAHPATTRSLLYGNPLAGDTYSVERTDQGKDFGSIHGNIGAIGAGIITLAKNLSGFGETIVEKLTSGPNKGRSIYYGLETGATGVGLRQGQSVRAGQTIARGLGTGGVEFGFWNPATGHAMGYQPGVTSGGSTPAGVAFTKFLQQIGQHGIYTTTNNQTGAVTGGGSNIGYTISQLEQAFTNAIKKAGDSLIQKLANVVQSGTVRTLSAALGIDTSSSQHVALTVPLTNTSYGHTFATGFGSRTIHPSLASALRGADNSLGRSASPGAIGSTLLPLIQAGTAGSQQSRTYQNTLMQLIATGQKREAAELVAAHKQAMEALAQEVYAEQTSKDAESLAIQSQKLNDQTTAITNAAQDQLNVVKAQYQLVNDAAQAQITAIRDMTQTITDQFSGMVQAVEDRTQIMSDAANALVTGINDQTQIQVDILGERGLYGLNLVAQKLQVGLDQAKASDDQKIAVAQQNLDQVTATEHQLVSNAQINLDQVTAAEDQVSALAQQRADTVAINQAIRLASAQARVDANVLHNDVAVVGPAQTAVDLNATAPKSVQDVLNAQLKKAQGVAGVSENSLSRWLADVQGSVNQITNAAQQQAQTVSDAAQTQIAAANATLSTVQGQANLAIAMAQGTLTGVQNTAALTEAGLQSGVSITQAQAATQFAGSGLVVNMYGIDMQDSTSVVTGLDWLARNTLQIS